MAEGFRIVFALFPRLTQLDVTGPLEVFKWLPDTTVSVASLGGGELTSDSGLRFAGVERLADIEGCDLLCVPGGFGLTAALADRAYVAEVRRLGLTARYVTSVCSGSLTIAAELAGDDFARGIALAMEYDPKPPFHTGAPPKAPPHVLAAVRERLLASYAERRAALLAARAELAGKP